MTMASQGLSCHVATHHAQVPGLVSGARILNPDVLIVSCRARSHSLMLSEPQFPPWKHEGNKTDVPELKGREKELLVGRVGGHEFPDAP